MTSLQALILGIVEGFTEYLPVSSTGHLILAQKFMGLGLSGPEKIAADAYAVCIQFGAIAAVLWLYFGRVKEMCRGLFGNESQGKKEFYLLILAFLPAAVTGFLLSKPIKETLFGLWPVVLAWFAGGVLILAVGKRFEGRTDAESDWTHMSYKQALWIGFAQCAALWPGTSRSLAVILGGLFAGLAMPAAVEFSFLLGLVTLSAATLHDAAKYGPLILQSYGWSHTLIGFAAAAVSAAAAVKWLVAYLNRRGLAVFGVYRILLALAVASLLIAGSL